MSYEVRKIKTISDLRMMFPTGEADELNFCLFSTSGVHGHYRKIEELDFTPDEDGELRNTITCLVVHPRVVALNYGTIEVEKKDVEYLLKLRKSSCEVLRVLSEGHQ